MKIVFGIFAMLLALGFSGCAPLPKKPTTPLPFNTAVRVLADDLFYQVRQNNIASTLSNTVFISDPVIDADSGDVTKTSELIQGLIEAEAKQKFPTFLFADMSSQKIRTASYILTGIMRFEYFTNNATKLNRLVMSITDTTTGLIVAHSDVWISDANLAFEPTPIYRNSPMFLKDKQADSLIATASANVGNRASKAYMDSLAVSALLNEASHAYEQGNLPVALSLFQKASEDANGQQAMKTYSGLYQIYFRTGQIAEAENAFSKLLQLAIGSGSIANFKFLFRVNDTDFAGDPIKLKEYKIWLRQIAKQIAGSGTCMDIVGHASHTGTEDYNKRLSLKRAERIQDRLQSEVKGVGKKTHAIGRGFSENKVGTGTDDERDALDRRVEFKLAACS